MNKTLVIVLVTAAVTYMLHSQISQLPLIGKLPSL